jgi:hypothetical protein
MPDGSSHPDMQLNLRGINAGVVKPGRIAIGDIARKRPTN